jgi:hypothetical protein
VPPIAKSALKSNGAKPLLLSLLGESHFLLGLYVKELFSRVSSFYRVRIAELPSCRRGPHSVELAERHRPGAQFRHRETKKLPQSFEEGFQLG